MDAGAMSSGWYYFKQGAPEGSQAGPFTWAELHAQASRGAIAPDDLVWNRGLPDWLPASQIPELISLTAPREPAGKPTVAVPPSASAPPARRAWLLPVLIPLVAIILVGSGLGAFLALRDGSDGEAAKEAAVSTSTSDEPTTVTTQEGLGKAQIVDADPAAVVETEQYGPAPANQILVLMAEGSAREEAEAVAVAVSGRVVGEMEYIGLYQIETSGTTAADLETAVQKAATVPGVDSAFPNGVDVVKAPKEGKKCSPLRDPMYETGTNAAAYEMIGMQEAWDVLRASGIQLNDAHVGIVDSSVYTQSGHDFTPELNFPDQNGKYPSGKAKVRGLSPKDTTGQAAPDSGGLSHGTQVAHIIGADPGSGATGVAGVLQDKLTMTLSNTTQGSWAYQSANPDLNDPTQYQGFYVRALVEMQKQVEAGATVINLSIGPAEPSANNAWRAQAYKRFFERMQLDHPEVLFVAAAGNENGALDGANYGPGGFKLPNVMTVGALDQTGDRATAADWYDQATLQKVYETRKAAGTIPAEWTLEDFTEDLSSGSNYATGDGEVSISACGSGVPTGLDPDGKPVLNDGTSFATPQVTAAAALLKSINPKLTAQEIKDILVRTAAVEVEQEDGTTVAVPADVGGKVLRVDNAVLEVINQLRGPGNELNREDLLELASVSLVADGGPADYTVTASVTRVGGSGTDLKITMTGEGAITGDTSQHLDAPGEVTWTVSPKEGNTPTIRVVRSDTGGCATLTIEELDLNGRWSGTFTFGSFAIDENTAPSSAEEGCSLALVGELLAKLQGRPLPMTMDITVDEIGNGTTVTLIDMSALAAELAAENEEVEVTYTNDPQTFPFTFDGETLIFQLDQSSAAGSRMSGTLRKEGETLVIAGTLDAGGTGFSVTGTWTVTKE